MIIAVTCENNEVFQHFGHTPAFVIYTAENNEITDEKVLECGDSGHGALAALLANENVTSTDKVGGRLEDDDTVTQTITREVLSKSGKKNGENIDWTITINKSGLDIRAVPCIWC